MFKQKTLRNPLRPNTPKLPSAIGDSIFTPQIPQSVGSSNDQTEDPLSLTKDGAGSTGTQKNLSGFDAAMQNYLNSFMDPRFAAFNKSIDDLKNNLDQNKARTSAGLKTAKTTPTFMKPQDEKKLKDSLLLADGGEEGYTSGDVRYDPKTGNIVPRVKLETALPGVPGENSDAVDILADMPEDFNFTGWDDKSAKQQQQDLQKAGVSPEDQLVLLNSQTSLETLAIIQDISDNRRDYGLSVLDVERISKELLQISNARIGAKNHDIPLGVNPTTRNTFLSMLDKKEQDLLTSFGFGVAGMKDSKNPNVDLGDQITDLLQGDQSISDLLHGNFDVYQVADQFFDDMSKLNSIIADISEGQIEFANPADKQRYLDYLTRAYEKNDDLYRNMLASKIDEAGLLQFPEWRLKQLVSDFSLTQLEGLVSQIDANGIKKLSRPGNFEKLMKILLSDTDSALNLMADETKSPICPYVWNGIDLLQKNRIQISGYFMKDGCYYTKLFCGKEEFKVNLGKKLPYEVAVEVKSTTDWDIAGEQIELAFKYFATPAMLADAAYGFATYNGVPAFLPENLSPSDVPYLGEFLDSIDPWDHTAHLTKDTITIVLVTHYLNSSTTEQNVVHFFTYNN